MDKVFTGAFTQQEPIPDEAIEAAVAVMRSGRLHRYNLAAGEAGEAALLEREFAAMIGARYCLATTSGGTAMQIALHACGVDRGDKVLTNGFTLSPVPGAIHAVGGEPILVESTENLTIDLDDLAAKARASGAHTLLVSHMRGHLADMEALATICDNLGVSMIEDCAHTMGAAWKGRPSGSFGLAACFSTQTYKHVNSGEGGFLTTDDDQVMARAVIRSGSYMLYERHLAAPGANTFADARLDMPNCSSRIDNLRAAILRPQLKTLSEQVERWNARYRVIEGVLAPVPGLALRQIPNAETHVGSSIQFRAPTLGPDQLRAAIADCAARGVELKWFGPDEPHGYTSRHVSWRYAPVQALPRTDRILATLLDMRIPLTFSPEDCALIAEIIADVFSNHLDNARDVQAGPGDWPQ
ncbi:MAG: DegT/DnrJ/EryC1/StrS family aminotransferase [Paracoccaceae bacterium]|nr:DegT/DnrJ/EryC1/StrS family aminotransferase [Paracoccaceae bacterium]